MILEDADKENCVDKVTHVRYFFESFVCQCKRSHILCELVTINEKL